VSGYLGGLPLIGGPITFYLAIDHGAAFAARSATVTLAAIAGQGAYLLAFTYIARRARWYAALPGGWLAFAIAAIAVALLPLDPFLALALAAAALVLAWRFLPHAQDAVPPPLVPRAELRLRLVAAFVLAAVIVWSAQAFGPVVSGVLLSLPVTGSIMPPFTVALYGSAALAHLMRGFVIGLSGFTAFFFAVATLLEPLGIPAAFGSGIGAAIAAVFTARHIAGYGR
jgi:hypothetical protein